MWGKVSVSFFVVLNRKHLAATQVFHFYQCDFVKYKITVSKVFFSLGRVVFSFFVESFYGTVCDLFCSVRVYFGELFFRKMTISRKLSILRKDRKFPRNISKSYFLPIIYIFIPCLHRHLVVRFVVGPFVGFVHLVLHLLLLLHFVLHFALGPGRRLRVAGAELEYC